MYKHIGPGPVNLLNVTSRPSPNELLVTWQQTTENNCRETSYGIQYTLLSQDQCLNIVEEDWAIYSGSGNSTHTIVQGLQPFSTYNVSVSAANGKGHGLLSFITQTTSMSGKHLISGTSNHSM